MPLERKGNRILTLKRYQMMSAKYEQEQKELTEEISMLDKIVRHQEETNGHFAQLMKMLYKYVGVDIAELTPTIVNEFVKKIIVHKADNSTGKHVQKIEIIFNFISEFDFPAISQPIIKRKA